MPYAATMIQSRRAIGCCPATWALGLLLAATPLASQQSPPLLLRAAKILPMDGPPIEHGEVLIEGKHIAAVGRDLARPAGTRVVELGSQWIVPGFVELHCHVGVTGGDINDTVLPHNMELRTLDLLLTDSPQLKRAAEAGVTTALVIPGSGSSIGGMGTLIKTAGPSIEQRLIRFPGALKIALHARGGNPARHAGDLGAGRLGLHWMLKQVMGEAREYHRARSAGERGDGPPVPVNPRLEALRGLFRGEFPVILHAYGDDDTMTAIRILKWGLGVPILLSHGVYDSYKIKHELAAQHVPMNIGPRQFELDDGRFVGNAAELYGAGVPISLCTDSPVVAEDQLPLQAAMAVRLGLPAEAALRGLTIEPAKAVFLDDRIGSLTPGKDADLSVFDGDPLDPRHAPSLVLIDGQPVLDRRALLRSQP